MQNHWSSWVDTKKIIKIRSPSVASEGEGGPQEPACYYDSIAARALRALAPDSDDSIAIRARAALALDLAPRAIPVRIYARKPCTSAYERPPRSSLMFGKVFPAADVASESRRQRSHSRPSKQGNRPFRKPFRPEPVVAQGQGRVDCRGRTPRRHPQGHEDQGRVCPLSRCTFNPLSYIK